MDPSGKRAFYSSNLQPRPASASLDVKIADDSRPKGCHLASGSWDKTIKIWDVEAGKEIRTLDSHTGCVKALAVLPDGRLASGSEDATIKIWDLDGRELTTLTGHSFNVSTLAVLKNGHLASGSSDRKIKIWDLKTGKEVQSFGEFDVVLSLAVLANGNIVCGSNNKTITIRKPEDGQEVQRLQGHEGFRYIGKNAPALQVFSLLPLPDSRLAAGLSDKDIPIWDYENGQVLRKLQGHQQSVFSLGVLDNGHLVSGSSDSTIKIWDLGSYTEVRTLNQRHIVEAMVVLSNGHLASASEDISVLSSESGQEVRTLTGHTSRIKSMVALPT